MAQRKSSNTRGSRTSSSRGDAEMFVNVRVHTKNGAKQQLGVWTLISGENQSSARIMELVRSVDTPEDKNKVFIDTLVDLAGKGLIDFDFRDMVEYVPTSEEDVPF